METEKNSGKSSESLGYDLKPCPFCGGKAILRKIINSGEYVCSCELCNATPAPWGQETKEEAIQKWNTREE